MKSTVTPRSARASSGMDAFPLAPVEGHQLPPRGQIFHAQNFNPGLESEAETIPDATNPLVVQQEVDGLRDLDVVDGDRGFVPICDDQVLLLGPAVQPQTPSGYTMDATASEISARKVCAH
jgi:hypothetical protein